jgi:hypothetical protein
MPEHNSFDPYYKWLGIPAEEQPPDHYRLLAIRRFEQDADVIDAAAEQRMTLLRSRQTGKHAALSQRLLNELSAARAVLLDPHKRRAYDEQLRRETAEVPLAPVPLAELPPVSAPTLPYVVPTGPPHHRGNAPARTPSLWPLAIALGAGAALLVVVVVGAIAVGMSAFAYRPEAADIGASLPPVESESDTGSGGKGPQVAPQASPMPLASPSPALPPPPQTIDLLAEIDLARDVVRGDFRLEDDALIVPQVQAAQLELPTPPPEAYRLEFVAQRLSGSDSLNCGIVCGGRQTMVVFDGFAQQASGLNLLDGRSASRSPEAYREPIFTDDAPRSIVCTVRPGKIQVLCGDKTIVDWEGDPARLSLDQRFWKVRTPGRLTIGGWGTSFKITQLRLTALSE